MLITRGWEMYDADKRIEGFSPQTLKAYQLQSKLLIRYFGDIDMNTITLQQLKDYLSECSHHLKPSSLAHRIRFLRSFFRWAHEEEYIQSNPSVKIKEPKTGKRIPKFLSEFEIEHLRDACISPMEKALFEFMFSTGCRIGEISNLDIHHIDWTNRSAIAYGKGDKEREVYFNVRCEIWLKNYLNDRNDDNEALFVTERSPRRMSLAQMRYIIKRISKRAGLSKAVYPHKLRHSYATHLLNNGAPLEAIQSLLGHEKSETTRIYAELSGKLRQDHYNRYF